MTASQSISKETKKSGCFRISGKKHFVISGPCSAESQAQVLRTAQLLKDTGKVQVFRAGLWKPRTNPNSYMGPGALGLPWLEAVSRETGMSVCTEIALPEHVDLCMQHGIRMFWLGARTVSNPFSVQELASAMKGLEVCVMVKNPLTPDPELWCGAIERLSKAGINDLGIIHRGFFPFEHHRLRNIPKWEIAIDMKLRYPDFPIICDVSHIAGKREEIPAIAQKALDLNMDGLMIESHYQPARALSDAQQQLTPLALKKMLDGLDYREALADHPAYAQSLEPLRDQVDSIDAQVVDLLIERMLVVEKIGAYKRDYNLAILQVRRWSEILKSRLAQGRRGGLSAEFLSHILKAIHEESIRKQSKIYRKKG